MAYEADRYNLVADIGGTNTRVALADGLTLVEGSVRRFRNADYPGLETVLRQYISDAGEVDCKGACVAVAGPVRDGVGEMTNLDWKMDNATLARAANAERVSILNDLQAQGYAVPHLQSVNLMPVIAGPEAPRQDATRMVVGAGTGFNAAPVYHTRRGRLVAPSEVGHSNMPIRSEADLRLAKFVETAHGFPGIEDVLAGRGLERIYAWLGHEADDTRELRGPDILAALERGDDSRAEETARVWVRILGSVVGNLALTLLPFGGIYLIGGVAVAFAPHLQRFGFDEAFRDKGRFAGFMHNFGVSVVKDDYAALVGCASHLLELEEL